MTSSSADMPPIAPRADAVTLAVAYISASGQTLASIAYSSSPDTEIEWHSVPLAVRRATEAAGSPVSRRASAAGTWHGVVHMLANERKIYAATLPTGMHVAICTRDVLVTDERVRELMSTLQRAWLTAAANPLAPLPGAAAAAGVPGCAALCASAASPGVLWPSFRHNVRRIVHEHDGGLEMRTPLTTDGGSPGYTHPNTSLHELRSSAVQR